jgi:hypothetical protein
MKRYALFLMAAVTAGPAIAADAPYSMEARAPVAVDTRLLPPCDSPGIFRRIASGFAHKERAYWDSNLTLTSFEAPVEIGYRPWGLEFIPRRFCQTRAMVSDGTVHDVYYSVGLNTGTLGVVNGVEWCVTGYDRNLAYAPGCRMAAP